MSQSGYEHQIICFYGAKYPSLFEIERRCMDREGLVIQHLNKELPEGFVLDVGAANGFTAIRLCSSTRTVLAFEPDRDMVDPGVSLIWVQGLAQRIPFHDSAFHAAYATWAFFFDGVPDIDKGLDELNRVVKNEGKIIIVDNAGDDEFSSLAGKSTGSNRTWWRNRGFEETLIHTSFRFDSLEEANRLLKFYFGDRAAQRNSKTQIEYKVIAYSTRVRKR